MHTVHTITIYIYIYSVYLHSGRSNDCVHVLRSGCCCYAAIGGTVEFVAVATLGVVLADDGL